MSGTRDDVRAKLEELRSWFEYRGTLNHPSFWFRDVRPEWVNQIVADCNSGNEYPGGLALGMLVAVVEELQDRFRFEPVGAETVSEVWDDVCLDGVEDHWEVELLNWRREGLGCDLVDEQIRLTPELGLVECLRLAQLAYLYRICGVVRSWIEEEGEV